MRWLVFMGIVATAACTRLNPSYGDGGGTGGGTSNDDDPSSPNDASASADDDDDDASASASLDDDANPDTGVEGTETGENTRPCCLPHRDVGCEEDDVEECVCSQVPDCCAIEWNDHCSQKARDCGAECGVVDDGPLEGSTSIPPMTSDDSGSATDTAGATSTSDGGSSTGAVGSDDCCTPHDGLGCADDKTSECVCEMMPQCCDEGWSADCVGQVAACAVPCPV